MYAAEVVAVLVHRPLRLGRASLMGAIGSSSLSRTESGVTTINVKNLKRHSVGDGERGAVERKPLASRGFGDGRSWIRTTDLRLIRAAL
jgi:hypothetical protein